MAEHEATSTDSAATNATRALRARRTRLSYHLRGKSCPPLSAGHIERESQWSQKLG